MRAAAADAEVDSRPRPRTPRPPRPRTSVLSDAGGGGCTATSPRRSKPASKAAASSAAGRGCGIRGPRKPASIGPCPRPPRRSFGSRPPMVAAGTMVTEGTTAAAGSTSVAQTATTAAATGASGGTAADSKRGAEVGGGGGGTAADIGAVGLSVAPSPRPRPPACPRPPWTPPRVSTRGGPRPPELQQDRAAAPPLAQVVVRLGDVAKTQPQYDQLQARAHVEPATEPGGAIATRTSRHSQASGRRAR